MDTRSNTGLVAVVDFSMLTMIRGSGQVASPAVRLGHDAFRDFVADKAKSGQVRVLLPAFSAAMTLATLRRKSEVRPLGFEVPLTVEDSLCLLLSKDPAESQRILQGFDRIYVASTEEPRVFQVVMPSAKTQSPEPVNA